MTKGDKAEMFLQFISLTSDIYFIWRHDFLKQQQKLVSVENVQTLKIRPVKKRPYYIYLYPSLTVKYVGFSNWNYMHSITTLNW